VNFKRWWLGLAEWQQLAVAWLALPVLLFLLSAVIVAYVIGAPLKFINWLIKEGP
jgi:hypothetical protein